MSNVQSVNRAIAIIKKLGGLKDGISVTNLSKDLDLNISTVYRLLKTLREDGIVTQNEITLRYSLGVGFLEIALNYLSSMDLRKSAAQHMKTLQEKTGETVNLALIDGFEVVYIDRIESNQDLRHSISIGKRAPVHCTSLGKAIIAFMNRDIISQLLLKTPLQKNTTFTKDSVKGIMTELLEIQKTRVAIDDREHQEHIRCVGSPIFDIRGNVVAAVSVSGPISRVTYKKFEELKKEIIKTAQSISEDLGWVETK